MFARGHHSMMGSTEDPEDGGKVATAVFGAVAVYGVRSWLSVDDTGEEGSITSRIGGRNPLEGDRSAARTKNSRTEHANPRRSDANAEFVQVFLLFCGSQAFLHKRQRAGGEIALR